MKLTRILGFLAVAGALVAFAPAERAAAMSLNGPGIAAAVQDGSANLVTEVRWRHHGYRRHYGYHRHYGWRRHYGWHRHHGYRHHRWHHRHWG